MVNLYYTTTASAHVYQGTEASRQYWQGIAKIFSKQFPVDHVGSTCSCSICLALVLEHKWCSRLCRVSCQHDLSTPAKTLYELYPVLANNAAPV
jgi:hypothetical protein